MGKTKEVASAIGRLEGVKSVDPVTGPYDIIAIVKGESLNNIGDIVTGKIHPIAGLSRMVTCLAIMYSGIPCELLARRESSQ